MHRRMADNENGVYALSRDLGDDNVCIVVNRSPEAQTVRLRFSSADREAANDDR